MTQNALETWHRLVRTQDTSGLAALLAEDAGNSAGQITEFKAMIRPLKAINLIHQRMGAMLQSSR